jgi:hypothetical protein
MYQLFQRKRVTQRRQIIKFKDQVLKELLSKIKEQTNLQLAGIKNIERMLREQLIQQNKIHTLLITGFGKNTGNENENNAIVDIQDKKYEYYLSYRQKRIQSFHINTIQNDLTTYITTQNTMMKNIEKNIHLLSSIKQNIIHQYNIQETNSTSTSTNTNTNTKSIHYFMSSTVDVDDKPCTKKRCVSGDT